MVKAKTTARRRRVQHQHSIEDIDDFVIPKFPKEPYEIDFLNESLSNSLIDDILTEGGERKVFIDSMKKQKFPKGHVVILQGDIADYFYIIKKGKVKIVTDDTTTIHSKGDCFGEMALLYDIPRTATCSAETDVTTFRINQKVFKHLTGGYAKKEYDEILNVLRKVPFLSELQEEDLIKVAHVLLPTPHKKGEKIIEKGGTGTNFYIVQEGTVKIHDVGDGTSSYDDQILERGDFFGERALLSEEPRAANVTAVTDCLTLTITREMFNNKLGELKVLLKNATKLRIMEGLPIFTSSLLKPYQLPKLVELFEEKTFESNTYLYAEDQPINNQGFYIIEEGQVRVSTGGGVITNLSKGDYFGENSITLKEGSKAPNTIEFIEKTTCSVLAKTSIESAKSAIGSITRLFLPTQYSMDLLDMNINDFHIRRLLGEGGFGTVYLVSHKKTEEQYAMKMVSKAQVLKYAKTTFILRERNIMASINHPFIVKMISTFQDDKNIYYLQSLARGGELMDRILSEDGGACGVSNDSAQFYAACIHHSLAFMHSYHIAYRDLKPENILIDDQGYCIVTDFGLAKIVPDKTFSLCGTPEYLAPEVIISKGYSVSVDNWSLGVLIFEMLAGHTPFYEKNLPDTKLFRRIIKSQFDFPGYGEFSTSSKDLIKRLIARNSSERLGSLARGEADIEAHEFFTDINMKELLNKNIKAPWIPEIAEDNDKSSIESDSEDECDSSIESLTNEEQAVFEGFGEIVNRTDDLTEPSEDNIKENIQTSQENEEVRTACQLSLLQSPSNSAAVTTVQEGNKITGIQKIRRQIIKKIKMCGCYC